MSTMSPKDPRAVIPANRDMVFEGYKKSGIQIGWASPRFLEAWSKEDEKIKYLSQLEGIVRIFSFIALMCVYTQR